MFYSKIKERMKKEALHDKYIIDKTLKTSQIIVNSKR